MALSRHSARHPPLLLLVCCIVAIASAAAVATSTLDSSEIVHLYPEQPRMDERLRCGVTQRYRVHDLDTTKVYDVKVSYPASVPTDFILEVDTVLLPASLGDHDDDTAATSRTLPVRRLNTAKLRLHPQELLLHALRKEQHKHESTYRLDVASAAQELTHVTLDLSLRAEVEGVSPVIDPRTRTCVFDIVVEEMLLGGAFPHDTLALIAWLVLLLALAFRVVYPFLLRMLTLTDEPQRHQTIRFGASSKES